MDTTTPAVTGPVLKPDDARRLRVQRFLSRIQAAKTSAERPGFRLRIAPQVYDPAKNVYVTWPERAWTMELQKIEDAEQLFAVLDRCLAAYWTPPTTDASTT